MFRTRNCTPGRSRGTSSVITAYKSKHQLNSKLIISIVPGLLLVLWKLLAGVVRMAVSVPGMDLCELQCYWGNFTFIVFTSRRSVLDCSRGTVPAISAQQFTLDESICYMTSNEMRYKCSIQTGEIQHNNWVKTCSTCSGVVERLMASAFPARGIEDSLSCTVCVKCLVITLLKSVFDLNVSYLI